MPVPVIVSSIIHYASFEEDQPPTEKLSILGNVKEKFKPWSSRRIILNNMMWFCSEEVVQKTDVRVRILVSFSRYRSLLTYLLKKFEKNGE